MSLGVATLVTSATRNFFAAGILQTVAIAAATFGALGQGRELERVSADRVKQQQVRGGWRTLRALYDGLGRVRVTVLAQQVRLAEISSPDGQVSLRDATDSLDTVDLLVTEQLENGALALEAWRDILPDEVEAIERQARGAN
jgi:hypothetical protein